MRSLLQLGYRLRRLVLRLLRIRTLGVKVMVFNARGELLLIRNGYGDRSLFALPGGGVKRSEPPEQAARREVREETALDLQRLSLLSTHYSTAEGKRDTVYLYSAIADGVPVADGLEVEEARFFAVDRLPERISPAALRRIEEHRAGTIADGRW